jgi:RNA polymerase sigma factor (sigma-70 family)
MYDPSVPTPDAQQRSLPEKPLKDTLLPASSEGNTQLRPEQAPRTYPPAELVGDGPLVPPAGAKQESSDETLPRQVQEGDQKAAEELMLSWTRYLYGITRRFGVDKEDLEDAVGDLTTHVLRQLRLGKYDPKHPFKPWLSTVAARYLVNQLKRGKYRQFCSLSNSGADLFARPRAEYHERIEPLVHRVLELLRGKFGAERCNLFKDSVLERVPYEELAPKYRAKAGTLRSKVSRMLTWLSKECANMREEWLEILEARP